MINQTATNTTGKKSHVSHHIIFITACAQNAFFQASGRRWRHSSRQTAPSVGYLRNSERPTRCWCIISVRRRTIVK